MSTFTEPIITPNRNPLLTKLRVYQVTTILLGLAFIGSLIFVVTTGLTPSRISELLKQPNDVAAILSRLERDANFTKIEREIRSKIESEYVGEQPSAEQLKTSLLKGYVDSLGDQYSQYLTPSDYTAITNSLNSSFSGIGIQFEYFGSYIEVQQVFPNTPAEVAGLVSGDRIVTVDDLQVSGLGSSEVVRTKITGPENTTVKLSVATTDGLKDLTLTRKKISFPLVTYTKQKEIGTIRVSSFGESLDKEMIEISSKIKSDPEIKYLILDLTNNTGGYLNGAVDLVSYFVPENKTVVIDKQKKSEETLKTVNKKTTLKDYPLVITGNKFTASASEITLGALQDLRGIKFVGSKTFGKGVVQQIYSLDNGAALKLTIAEWYTPLRRTINKVGISPDFFVEKDEVKSVLERYDWATNTLK